MPRGDAPRREIEPQSHGVTEGGKALNEKRLVPPNRRPDPQRSIRVCISKVFRGSHPIPIPFTSASSVPLCLCGKTPPPYLRGTNQGSRIDGRTVFECHRRVDPLLIVLIGTAVMVIALMGFRLHAFLALILAAFVVSVLTSAAVRQGRALQGSTLSVTLRTEGELTTVTPAGTGLLPTGPVVLFRRDSQGIQPLAEGNLVASASPNAGWILNSLRTLPSGGIEAGLVSASVWKESLARSRTHPLELVAEGFGATCASIGLLIILASVIGECLTASGAADRIVRWIQEQFGERRAPQALASSAFLLGIPVFFDTVFYLLMPLGRGLAVRSGRDFLLYTLSIVAGATMAHSLVPPTPGPLFAAREFGVPLGTMMIGGTIVGLLSVGVGFLYARWANGRWPIPVPADPAMGDQHSPARAGSLPASATPPALVLAMLPILLPVTLIGLAESWQALASEPTAGLRAMRFLGQGTMALSLGTVAALLLLARSVGWRWARLRDALSPAVAGGGVILLITAAGGAFGAALRQTDVASRLAQFSGGGGWGLLLAAFVVTALVRIAQGSATVAMLTAAGVVAPVALAMSLPFHPVYLALAVGCGSKPIPWMNDSGFWIIGRMSGMSEIQTLKTASVMMSLMGCVGFGVVLLGAWLLPLK